MTMKAVLSFLLLFVVAAGVLRAQPQKGYDVHYYNATVKLDRAQDSLWGNVTMTATADSSISQILQYIKYLTIDSVFVNNVRANIQYGDTQSGEYFVTGNRSYRFPNSSFDLLSRSPVAGAI